MSTEEPPSPPGLTEAQVSSAIRLSYVQAMAGAVYSASTGGMFLIGYALMLGATNVQIGLMSTIPMLCIGVQLLPAALIERGVSRRLLTVVAALGNVLTWLLIILIPYVLSGSSPELRIGALIATIAAATFFAYISGNARSSWLGDLIPARLRGSFFGRITMFAGIIGAVFAILEGRLLDTLKGMGIGAFSCLFGFGVVVGLVHVAFFLPQADVPVQVHESGSIRRQIAEALRNGPLMTVMFFALLWSMQMIAGPFYSTYMIRDLKMSFLGIGLLNSIVTAAVLLSGPFWGRMVDRYGCRPVLTACSCTLGLVQLVWLGAGTAHAAYCVLPPANLVAGLSVGGVSVALSTLIYKVTPAAGRAVQFAVYSIIVTLVVAPMPVLGAKLPQWVGALVPGADLRFTFYACVPMLVAASLVARRIREPEATRTRVLLRALPGHVREVWQRVVPGMLPFGRDW